MTISIHSLKYWIADHPAITGFVWSSARAASWQFMLSAIASYLFLTAILWQKMRSRPRPTPLGLIPAIHNVLILSLSALMVMGCWNATVAEINDCKWMWAGSRKAQQWVFCFPPGTQPKGRVFFWSYVFYLSKFYEFLDTFILLLKKRPLTFLHVYHHALVVVMCFLWLEFSQSLQIIALITNASVHTLMYSYYLLCTFGYRPPWKKIVTNCQIVQFLFSFLVSVVLLWLHFTGEGCSGFGAWIFNAVFNVSLLALFVDFRRRQYTKGSRKAEREADKVD